MTTEADWLDAVATTLRGRPFESLRTSVEDGFVLEPVYTASSTSGPFPVPAPRPGGSWDVRTVVEHPDLASANAEVLRDLERGATSVSITLDRQRRDYGRPALDPASAPAVLDGGPAVGWLDDLAALLDGVHLDLAEVAYDAGWSAMSVGQAHLALGDERGIDRSTLLGSFGFDPFASWNRSAGGPLTIAEAVDRAAGSDVPEIASSWPLVRPLAIDTVVYASAGATDAEELAILVSAAVEWIRAAERLGIDPAVIVGRIEARLAVGADVFAGVAKMRVARRLWAAVLGACGVAGTAQGLRLQAVSSPRMYTRIDPWVNLLRGTAACFAASVGGADGVTVLSFDHRHGLPGELGRRLSRNTQTVLAEEAHLGAVVDPAAGSWYLDTRSQKLAEAAWSEFQRIEAGGGLIAVIESGELGAQLVDQAVARASRVASREQPLTGVTEYPLLDERRATVAEVDVEVLRTARAAVVADRIGPAEGGADAESAIAALRSGAALAAWGEGRPGGEGLPVRHLSDDVEQLRSAAEEFRDSSGSWPRVFLANLGPLAEHTVRTTFATNLLATGGIEGVGPEGELTLDALVAAFRESGTTVACLCSSDERYGTEGRLVVAALRSAGAELVLVAGRAAVEGVDDHLALGIDVVDALNRLHVALGVNP